MHLVSLVFEENYQANADDHSYTIAWQRSAQDGELLGS